MNLSKLAVISFVLLCSCAKPPDVLICVELLHEFSGWCTFTISDKEIFLDNDKKLYNGKTWSDLKKDSLIMPADSYAKIKAYILSECKKHKDCGLEKIEKKTTDISRKISQ